MSRDIRAALTSALVAFATLVDTPAVGAAWDDASALDGYTVGGLVGHVVSSTSSVYRYIDGESPDAPTHDKVDYYAVLPGPAEAPALHAEVRGRGTAIAATGHQSVSDQLRTLIDGLPRRLADAPGDQVMVVIRGIAITIDDYLETRIVELVVHHGDVQASIGGFGDPPPPEALAIAVDLLIATARRSHGDLAVLTALARVERDSVAALRVL